MSVRDKASQGLYPTKPVIDLQRSDCSAESEEYEDFESCLSEASTSVDRHTRQSGRSPGGSCQANLDSIDSRMAIRSAISLLLNLCQDV